MSHYALLICISILLLPPARCKPVPRYFTREQTTCQWQWWWPDPITRPDEIFWIVAPTAACSATTCTSFMTSDIPETKETPYTIHDDWLLLVAAVWTIVELTVPPPTQDAGDTTGPKVMKPESNEAPQATSSVKGIKPEEDKRLAEGPTINKNKETCQVPSLGAICDFIGLNDAPSCDNTAVLQTGLSGLSQCHQYNDNSQAFAEWKGSSQPSCPKWGAPPYLQGRPSRSSGPEAQNSPSGATASTERSLGQGSNVPPFN